MTKRGGGLPKVYVAKNFKGFFENIGVPHRQGGGVVETVCTRERVSIFGNFVKTPFIDGLAPKQK